MFALVERIIGKGFFPLLIVAVFLVASCGGSGGGGGSVTTAGGGIGGTGVSSGVITGFGSVILGTQEFNTNNASFTVDGDSTAMQSDLSIGMKVVIHGNLVNQTADSVTYEPEVKGPVDSIDLVNNQLIVMGQAVRVDSGTKYSGGIAGIFQLIPGTVVEVSGFFNTDGTIQATFVGLEDPNLQEFEVKGTVSNHDGNMKTFTLNTLTVNYDSVSNMATIHGGDFVEVQGRLQGGVLVADYLALTMMTPQVNDGDKMDLEGVVTALPSGTDHIYSVNGMSVKITTETRFEEGGSEADLALDVRIDVNGTVSGGVLVADQIEIEN